MIMNVICTLQSMLVILAGTCKRIDEPRFSASI